VAKRRIRLKVNGELKELDVEPWRTLLEVLREDLGLTSVKEGCGTGDCGSCTVILNGRAVNSCLVLAVDADGGEVLTVEGLSNGSELHPLQKAFIKHGAIQCGFCTPGMIMAAKALLDENPNPSPEEVKEALSGNICRCAGYSNIVKAVLAAARGEVDG